MRDRINANVTWSRAGCQPARDCQSRFNRDRQSAVKGDVREREAQNEHTIDETEGRSYDAGDGGIATFASGTAACC